MRVARAERHGRLCPALRARESRRKCSGGKTRIGHGEQGDVRDAIRLMAMNTSLRVTCGQGPWDGVCSGEEGDEVRHASSAGGSKHRFQCDWCKGTVDRSLNVGGSDTSVCLRNTMGEKEGCARSASPDTCCQVHMSCFAKCCQGHS